MSTIIIGKRGFIAQNLVKFFLKKKIKFLNVSLNNFLKLKKNNLLKFKNVINCSINKKIINNKYKVENDFDLKISNKIKFLNIRYIFLSTRKVYGKNKYPNENSYLSPRCNYSKNKLISEKKCLQILKNKLVILRISNLIGYRSGNKKRLHKTFIDHFCYNLRSEKFIFNFSDFKDFLSINQFCLILYKICQTRNISGVFNVSMGKKIYLIDLIKSLIKYHPKKISLVDNKKIKSDNFVLDNKKLLRKLRISINKNKLFIFCNNLSRNII